MEATLPPILPEEVLGWLLMRRSGLPSTSKLSIVAASGNSLRFADIEKATRQQEEELLQERQRQPSHRPHRTYWVESEGSWGLFLNDVTDQLEGDADDQQIQWVDQDAFHELVGVASSVEQSGASDETAWFNDGRFDWQWHEDEWHACTDDGWVAFSDLKPWLDVEEIMFQDQAADKEVQDLYASFDQKVRSFREARDAVYSKGKNRGFYHGLKGKLIKGSSKGKSKVSMAKPSSSHVLAVQSVGGKGKGSPVGKPGYSGCFICGDRSHDFRSCPKRGQSSMSSTSSASKSKPICFATVTDEVFMLEETDLEPPPTTLSLSAVHRMVLAASSGGGEASSDSSRLGFAVVDTGATETVGSLDAIEYVMSCRRGIFGAEEIGVCTDRVKRFKFGNAQERVAESFVHLPQTIDGVSTSLGVYTLDVPGVPILLGIKTLGKLGATIAVDPPSLEFTKLFPGVRIPLKRGNNGHLLLDLCHDWNGKEKSGFGERHDMDMRHGINMSEHEAQVHQVHVVHGLHRMERMQWNTST